MPCRSTNADAVGEERAHLARGQRREQGPPAGGEVRGQPHADVGDERRSAWRALLQDVEDVAAVQHREVRALAGPLDEGGERTAGDPLERCLPGVAAADLEGGETEPVRPLVGEVHDEAVLDHRVEQVVRRAARQVDSLLDPGERDRLRLARQELQHLQGAFRCRDLAHASTVAKVSYPRHSLPPTVVAGGRAGLGWRHGARGRLDRAGLPGRRGARSPGTASGSASPTTRWTRSTARGS